MIIGVSLPTQLSFFEIIPIAVVCSHNVEEIIAIMKKFQDITHPSVTKNIFYCLATMFFVLWSTEKILPPRFVHVFG